MLWFSSLNVSKHANKQPMAHIVNNERQANDNLSFKTILKFS